MINAALVTDAIGLHVMTAHRGQLVFITNQDNGGASQNSGMGIQLLDRLQSGYHAIEEGGSEHTELVHDQDLAGGQHRRAAVCNGHDGLILGEVVEVEHGMYSEGGLGQTCCSTTGRGTHDHLTIHGMCSGSNVSCQKAFSSSWST